LKSSKSSRLSDSFTSQK